MTLRFRIQPALALPAMLLLSACAVAPGMTAQEETIQQEAEINKYMPASRDMRDNIETQPLFAQAAFWSHEYDLNPSDLESALKLAAAVRKLGNPARAVEITQTTRAIHPRDPYLLAEFAAALIADQRAMDAVAPLDQGLRLAPQYARLWSLKGAALDQMEDYDTARRHYSRALSITPNDPNVLANVGLSHALSGDPVTAEQWLRRAVAAPGASAGVRQNLALVLQLQGKTEEAQRQHRIAGQSRADQKLPHDPIPAHQARSTSAQPQMRGAMQPRAPRQAQQQRRMPRQGAVRTPQQPRQQATAQAPSYGAQAPAARIVTQGQNGQPFASASDAARAAARKRQAAGAAAQQPMMANGEMTAEQQALLARIGASVQPTAATPPAARQAAAPHVVGPALRSQPGARPQPGYGQPQGYAPQPQGYPPQPQLAGAPTSRRGAARSRR